MGPEAAKAAREFTATTLRAWQMSELLDESLLVASELVANAIRHGLAPQVRRQGEATITVAWQWQASRLLCMVTDQSSRPPVLVPADPSAESGRGLRIVQAIAVDWGWTMLGQREKVVWAALAIPALVSYTVDEMVPDAWPLLVAPDSRPGRERHTQAWLQWA